MEYLNTIFFKGTKKLKARARSTVRKYAINHNVVEYKCSMCGNNGYWNGLKMPLELHHIDADNNNNRPENLTFLCPNCHSQTVGWRRKK